MHGLLLVLKETEFRLGNVCFCGNVGLKGVYVSEVGGVFVCGASGSDVRCVCIYEQFIEGNEVVVVRVRAVIGAHFVYFVTVTKKQKVVE